MPFSWDAFLEAALKAGIRVEEFWRLTMKETYQVIRAAQARDEQGRRERIEAAWYGAAFARMKELPKLSTLFETKEEAKNKARESARLFAESQERYRDGG